MVKIIEIRKRLGIGSQAALAKRLGVDQATISRWETGERKPSGPALVLLKQLAAEAGNQKPKPKRATG